MQLLINSVRIAVAAGLLLATVGAAIAQPWGGIAPWPPATVQAPDLPIIDRSAEIAPVPATLSLPRVATRPAGETFGAFGSYAISSRKLPAAAKWRTVSAANYSLDAGSSGLAKRLRGTVRAASGQGVGAQLRAVNSAVNKHLNYASDQQVWGTGDYWATPAEIVSRGYGDCEDFAITKYWLLRGLGYQPEQLQLVVLLDTRSRLYHAVLAVHANGQRYILDNLSAKVRTDDTFANYLPIMSFVGDRSFIHGFKSGRSDVAQLPNDLSLVLPGNGNGN